MYTSICNVRASLAMRRLFPEEKWRIIRMKNDRMSCRAVARQLWCLHSVITRLLKNKPKLIPSIYTHTHVHTYITYSRISRFLSAKNIGN